MNDLPVLLEKQNTQSEESDTPKLSNARISSLLFADDLAFFSLMLRGSQEKPDIGENYYRQSD